MRSASLTRLTLASLLLAGALAAAPAPVWGQSAGRSARRLAEGDGSSRATLVSERQRVRGDLERANAEIDALKRSGRGLREDYRLRERLADAEALARRLTELDARLGTSATPATRAAGAEPRVSAADGPAELEAKADILADQAQRLAARGDALLGRARDLRARQTLRRRVGQMERDPFSPLEGSKRRTMTGSLTTSATSSGGSQTGTRSPPSTTLGSGEKVTTPAPGGVTTDQSVPSAPVVGPAGATASGPPTSSPPTNGQAVASPTTAAPSPTSGVTTDGNALAAQLRDLLDPTTLAEIQHLEAAGGASTGFDALERAGAALKARAERLRQQAAALRASERPAPRTR